MLPLLLFLAQTNEPAPVRAQDGGWVLLDGVAVQAGDHVVTLRALDKFVRQEAERNRERIQSQDDIDDLTQVLVRRLVLRELEAQAGEDMGLDREQIDRIVQAQLAENSSQIPTFVDELLRQGEDAFSWSTEQKKDLYRYVWEKTKVGEESFGDKRPTRDRHIRPGELRAIYRANKDDLEPDRVELQILVLSVRAAGGLDAARSILEGARQRALAGEDFGALVQEIASERVETQGMTGLVPINAISDPGLHDFAAKGGVGDIGEILTLPQGGPTQALVLPRLNQKVENDPPPFDDRRIQTLLRKAFEEKRTERILGRERAELGKQAFTWLSPGLRESSDPPRSAPRAP